MSFLPILILIALVILVIFFLINKKAPEEDREGVAREVLKKDAIAVDFGTGRTTVVKLFGITLAAESEMLDEKIYSYFEDNILGKHVKVRIRVETAPELISGQVYTMSGEYLNASLVRLGFARWSPSEAAADAALSEAQAAASAEQLGVWNPAIRQLAEERRRSKPVEEMSDDEISNLSIDPSEEDSKDV